MKVINGKREFLDEQAAELIKEEAKKFDNPIIGVVGGRSVSGIYEKLKGLKAEFYLLDERKVPKEDKESNYQVAKVLNVHPFSEEYKKINHFDIVILSAGEDGHVAGLFPEYTILHEGKEYFEFDNSPKPPKDRFTASRELIETAKFAVLLFYNKEEAFKNFSNPVIPVELCPAKLVLGMENVVFRNISEKS